MLGELRDSLDARGLTFDWDGSLVDYLVKKSYSVQYGARNLRRTIQKDLEDPIAEKLIDAYQNPLHALQSLRSCQTHLPSLRLAVAPIRQRSLTPS